MKKREIVTELIKTEFCVIGGGLAGICAAVAAARRGVKVVLIHDRPVLGGNSSSEIKMWVRGASIDFPEYREGGIIEEIAMRNAFYNPEMTYAGWDGVLYGLVKDEPNVKLFLNTSCCAAEYKKGKILSVTAWQLTSYKKIKVSAEFFADCSGDGILSYVVPAPFTSGREGKKQYGENLAPDKPDKKTMGNSCLLQARETEKEITFKAPPFAHKFTDEEFNGRMDLNNPESFKTDNFWWIELGGEGDVVTEAESINDRLISYVYGVWDYIKNSGKFDSAKWELDWVGFLGAKRESRRYIGDYVLSQTDLEKPTVFLDEIAYGGWAMDDHDPYGMDTSRPPNRTIALKKPYGIPYRCLYSRKIKNLFFAGRNISATHIALSSSRVMATCSLMGQAAGTACAVALERNTDVRGAGKYISVIQRYLRDDDCYLLNTPRIPYPILAAEGDARFEVFKSGAERSIDGAEYRAEFEKGEEAVLEFASAHVKKVRFVFDNDVARKFCKDFNLRMFPLKLHVGKNDKKAEISPDLCKSFQVYVKTGEEWKLFTEVENNYRRLVYIDINEEVSGVKFVGKQTFGAEKIYLISFDIIT